MSKPNQFRRRFPHGPCARRCNLQVRIFNSIATLVLLLWVSASAIADGTSEVEETPRESEGLEYPASFFARFAPRTARDMIDRIPGFVPRELEEARGLGQASSNILINGARASGKQDSALNALGRIPARTVQRIRMLDGASLGIPGLSGDVVDVIIDDEVTRGSWLWRTHHRPRLEPVWYRFDASLTGKHKALSWVANLQNQQDRLGHWGPEKVYDGSGQIIEQRQEFASYSIDRPGGSLRFNWAPDSGKVANLSLLYHQRLEVDEENSFRVMQNGPSTNRYLDVDEPRWIGEVSADYEFAAARGRLKLIGYQRYEKVPRRVETVVFSAQDVELGRELFKRNSEIGETIVRTEYRWQGKGKSKWQLAAEGVYNYIDAASDFLSSENGAALVAANIDNGSAKVEEKRAEATLTYGTSFANDLNLQLSLGAEFSRLQQSGAAGLRRDFTRPKGFISISKSFWSNSLLSLKLAREVGQLDFFDFLSSVDVDVENSAEGNPKLVPPQTWHLDARLEQEYGAYGDLSVRLWYEEIDDIVDFIPIGTAGEAAGNLDSAKRYGGQWVSTLYLDEIGLPGAQLEFNITLQRSELADPLTGKPRRINGDRISYFFTEFRHDVPASDWAWGLNYGIDVAAETVRRNETQRASVKKGELRAFLEHKDVFGLKASLSVRNLLDDRERFKRTLFDGSRNGTVQRVENRARRFGAVFEFQIEGSF